MPEMPVSPLDQVTTELVDVAVGRRKPDLVITNGRLMDVYSGKIRPNREIWIRRGRIAAIRPSGTAAGRRPEASLYDARGRILAPGLVDPHVHVESSMVTVCAFAEAALRNGTTTIVYDPHEIANVADEEGIQWMLEDARRASINAFMTVPSTVPATLRRVETSGGDIDALKMGRLLDRWPEALGAGEKMDYVSIASGTRRTHEIIAAALKRGKPVSGHFYGMEFVAPCAAAGITDTHEAVDGEIGEAALEAGMWLLIRGGPPSSPWDSLPAVIQSLTKQGCWSTRVCLCTDDRSPEELLTYGLDYVVRQAVSAGIPCVEAWAMASLHPAMRYGLDSDLGGLGPGRRADIVTLCDDLEVQDVWFGGQHVIARGEPTEALEKQLTDRYPYPEAASRTVRVAARLPLLPEIPSRPCMVHAIQVNSDIVTRHITVSYDGRMPWTDFLHEQDLSFVAVVERHGEGGGIGRGLIQGFGLRDGAVGSSVGHDAHNLLLAGDSERDLRVAFDTIVRDGGVCVVSKGKVLGHVPLPVAGLMSEERVAVVASQMEDLRKVWVQVGCKLPFMGFNLLPLSVIPELRITDKGLVKVPEMEIIPLVEFAGFPEPETVKK